MPITAILESHFIEVIKQNGRIWALDEVYHSPTKTERNEWKDATDWTKRQALIWLGY